MHLVSLWKAFLLIAFLASVESGIQAAEPVLNEREWADGLELVSVAVEECDYHVWGSSPVIGPEGKTHLFVARWPVKETFWAWITHCEIARYESDQPEGPFVFQETVVRGTNSDTWDRKSPHNPSVQKIGDRYVLVYIANEGGPTKVATQRIGMQIADHPAGPWRRVGDDGLILSPPSDPTVWCHGSTVGVNNPALLAHPDGRFFLYYKAMKPGGIRQMGVAIADRVEGPYVFHSQPLTSNTSTIEDGYAFCENGKIYLLTTDNKVGAGFLWESDDGIHFGAPTVGFDRIGKYFSPKQLKGATSYRGQKFERPQILVQDGRPTHLYVASGTNINGGKGACSYVLRIKEP